MNSKVDAPITRASNADVRRFLTKNFFEHTPSELEAKRLLSFTNTPLNTAGRAGFVNRSTINMDWDYEMNSFPEFGLIPETANLYPDPLFVIVSLFNATEESYQALVRPSRCIFHSQ